MGCFSLPTLKSFKNASKRPSIRGPPATRLVPIGHKPPPRENIVYNNFPDNRVITSKYTIWNFLPKNLFGQFRRIANFYFLCVAVIQLSINSPVNPATSLAPLIFVVVITAIKQAFEDWLRHKADSVVNKQLVRVIRDDELKKIKSQDIKVGDIVMVKADEEFPCDLVLISSSDLEGHCHITTANLDGETNLKRNECLPETKDLNTPENLIELKGSIECQLPNADLYRFLGRMSIYVPTSDSVTVRPLNPVNLLLKGARLKHTNFIYGCAVYTGPETKMVLNLKLTSNKFSTVERSMNTFLIVFLILLLSEVTIATILKYQFPLLSDLNVPWYLPPPNPIKARVVFADFLAFLILFNYIIPISLYVSLELVKFIGAMFFAWDSKLYDPESGECGICNTSDLNEELGQVEYLFTDKTGTLTENLMQFRQCSIEGVRFVENAGMLCHVPEGLHAQPEIVHKFTQEIENFLLVLAVCNTVQINRKTENGFTNNATPEDIQYQASSPDEKALVEACKMFGVVLSDISENHYKVNVRGKIRIFKRLHVLEFDSTRKCMSVVVQDERGDYLLLCKGAETTVLENSVAGLRDITLQHVDGYAVSGLRTLVVAIKKMSVSEYRKFSLDLEKARNSMGDREEQLYHIFCEMETGLTVLGATAVEDRLQDGVSQTLQMLRGAGIRVWVLTGDKHETAMNISYSCKHIQPSMIRLNLTQQINSQECLATLQLILTRILSEPLSSYALIVDGSSLSFSLSEHKDIFAETSMRCEAVLCCRMSPLQKSQVVSLIKRLPSKPITAAIGDGANDVSMIQEAHIGLAIIGKEGRQAVRCSDFAFAKFKFLQRVLLVHGHYYYVRVALLVQYFFYKNVAFITPQVIYAIFSAFSTQPLYHSIYLMFYNIFFTSLPILFFGLLEQNIPQETLMSSPNLYKNISRNASLTKLQFLKWVMQGVWHSLVCFFGTYAIFHDDLIILNDGQLLDIWSFGTAIYQTVVFVVNFKLLLHTRYWTAYSVGAVVISLVGFEGFSFLYSGFIWPFQDNDLYYVYFKMSSSPSIWFSLILLVTTALLPDIIGLMMENNTGKVQRFLQSIAASCLKPTQPLTLFYSANPHQPEISIFHISHPNPSQ